MSQNITLVVMAAGMGSRFGGLKQMAPIGPNGEALLDYSVYDAVKAGFHKIVFVISKAMEEDFKELVGKRISKLVSVEYVIQEISHLPEGYVAPAERVKPWGTAHAVLRCKDVVKEPFAVINADDFYGCSAFAKMSDFLRTNSEDYCMIGYRLKNTLTENGSVSRGVCKVRDGILQSVIERTRIVDCKYTVDEGKSWQELAPDTVVSMNLWGFQPDVFRYIEQGFCAFLSSHLENLKAEYYLPTVVSELIDNGTKQTQVLIAEDKWYGITYKEDQEVVEQAIEAMVEKGIYPSSLG